MEIVGVKGPWADGLGRGMMSIADPASGQAVSAPSSTGARAPASPSDAPRRRDSTFDGVFCSRVRTLGIVYVAATLPLAALGGLLVDGPDSYVLVFVLLGSAIYTTPAVVVTWYAQQRAAAPDRRSWQLWLAALVALYAVGALMILGASTDVAAPTWTGVAAVVVIAALLTVSVIRLARSRSGGRALSVDVAECVIAVVTVTAPALLLWGERIVDSPEAWFTIPAAVSAVAMVSGCYWSMILLLRLGRAARTTERFGVVLTCVGAINGAVQVAMGLSGFTLFGPPIVALQAISASMILLVPLFLPRGLRLGLGSLPPHAQVRGGGLSAVATLVGLPALLGTTALVRDETPWAIPFTVSVLAFLLAVGALRHLATINETRRLYAEVERAAQARRELLTAVMQRADQDRHRVAAQLHEQAVAAYASFVSFIQASGTSLGDQSPLSAASSRVRDDLASHADSLRQLLLAIAPLDRSAGGTNDADADAAGLGALVRAYLDNLYGDRPAPRLRMSIAGRLVLDWTTETIALRIVQEALRNVRRHSHATSVDVMVDAAGDAIQVHVVDDGVGFDAEANLFESGIAAMREFAALTGGTLDVASAPGRGTTVTAHLGRGPKVEPVEDDVDVDADIEFDEYDEDDPDYEPDFPPTLRLVHGGRDS
jgi:signal transduction histidine kinase